MKKNLFLLILLFCVPIVLMAQDKKFYCEAEGYLNRQSYIVYLDFGDLRENPSLLNQKRRHDQ